MTVYTFHHVKTNEVLEQSKGADLRDVAMALALNGNVKKVYVHNGVGVVCALAFKDGKAWEVDRLPYLEVDHQARQSRKDANVPNY